MSDHTYFAKVQAFRNLYGFLSQVIPYQDSELERLYVFLRHLAAKLPHRKTGTVYQFDDEVRLEYYRLQKISEGSISLRDGTALRLDGPTEVGSGMARPQSIALSQLIDVVNERFGTDFNQADQLFFDQIVEVAVTDEGLRQAAAVNPSDKFELVFKHLLENLFVERSRDAVARTPRVCFPPRLDSNQRLRRSGRVRFERVTTSTQSANGRRSPAQVRRRAGVEN